MTVEELLNRISSKELSEWLAYYALEPFGEDRADLRAGIISSTVANVNRVKGKAYQPEDFIPKFDKEEKQSWEQQLRIVEMLNTAFRGKDLRGKDLRKQ